MMSESKNSLWSKGLRLKPSCSATADDEHIYLKCSMKQCTHACLPLFINEAWSSELTSKI